MTLLKQLLFVSGVSLFLIAHLFAGQTVNFTNDDTLKAVFASGLRPWMYAGSTTDECEITDVEITLLLPNSRKISELPVKEGSFRVFGDYTLSQANFSSGLLDVVDATKLAERVAGELGMSPEGIESLAMQASPTKLTSPSQWSGQTSVGQINAFLRFVPIPRFNEVKAIVELRLNWKRPSKGTRYWVTRMPPPPGYEKMGFGTPPPTTGPQVPNPGPEYYEALLRAKNGERPTPGITPSTVSTPIPLNAQSNASATPITASEKPISSNLPIVVSATILTFLIASVAVLFWHRRSPKQR